jgi:hypothetical protein
MEIDEIELEEPKFHKGTYFPSLIRHGNVIEDVLWTVAQRTYR